MLRFATLAVLADAGVRAAAQAAAGAALQASGAWVPLASNLTSFLILSSTFVDDGERDASACYLAGLGCTAALLAQAHWLHAVPPALFWPAAALALASAAVNAAKLAGLLDAPGPAAALWPLWRRVVGCVGWAMVPQVAYLSLVRPASTAHAAATWGPAGVSMAAGAALLALLRAGWLPPAWRGAWDVASWTATLLFMMKPLAALAAAALEPATLLDVSPAAFLLPALATGLQVPRALLRCGVDAEIGSHMWLTGTSWATAFACVQAAVAAVAQGKPGTAAVALAAPLLFAACLLRTTATAQGSHLLLAPLQPVAAAYRQEARPWRLLLPRLSLRWALAAARSRRATRRLASQGLPSTACAP
ncbi:maltose excess chloroplastic-like [Micractinium conductrix]|uniref:Maltose excess chloroplastic-like n=1 Tax=Micractinium conductrix TaxID=554055 RepID=A0A2P6VCH9_9CHLO|nr:maltose excess chloroplastic-like [Micractinium conductrix]|eukprot:PSC71805.1 maltose excess chloroplastic-like [Micractinium conductrix]